MADPAENPEVRGLGPQACPHCGSLKIRRNLELGQTAEAGHIGLPYRAGGIFTGTEALLADLCETCGTVVRLSVKETRRKWISS
ncbi:MAG TPA: hypothetical protein PKM35_05515 [Holophaga sp.]|nr:hypothetical protein [Holophaga sp.]HPS68020.1 hypothetical protein [Holophaga sp.]